jgi:hypothetical protein
MKIAVASANIQYNQYSHCKFVKGCKLVICDLDASCSMKITSFEDVRSLPPDMKMQDTAENMIYQVFNPSWCVT